MSPLQLQQKKIGASFDNQIRGKFLPGDDGVEELQLEVLDDESGYGGLWIIPPAL